MHLIAFAVAHLRVVCFDLLLKTNVIAFVSPGAATVSAIIQRLSALVNTGRHKKTVIA